MCIYIWSFSVPLHICVILIRCFREVQRHRQALVEKLAAFNEEQTINEEEVISKAAAEAEARLDKQQREKDEKKAAMLKSIAEHRESVVNFIFGNMANYQQSKIKQYFTFNVLMVYV